MHHLAVKVIDAHLHNMVHRNVVMTQEVLFIKKGKLCVDFYDNYEDYLESIILDAGDTILLVSGGHGYTVLEEVEMIEVKQGTYSGDKDKVRFAGITDNEVIIEENADGKRMAEQNIRLKSGIGEEYGFYTGQCPIIKWK